MALWVTLLVIGALQILNYNELFPSREIILLVVLEAALAGSDVITMGADVLEQLYHHPLTDAGIDIFLKDWAKVPKK